ncbi:MAG: hypothetical protein CVV23_01870 [Ignavibacteriae bacterium HGW-Ignavibacteriae-2]|nr:hypothetical protein [Bacteroidota bacterium]PKL90115.1 MAG: hypothetical protein CVV23_01870 [Ignavibacteriae bacterium HGW-Ignavibacteriae-2]
MQTSAVILILFIILMLGILGGVLYFIMWIDKKIDMKNRMGYSAYLKKNKPKPEKETEID